MLISSVFSKPGPDALSNDSNTDNADSSNSSEIQPPLMAGSDGKGSSNDWFICMSKSRFKKTHSAKNNMGRTNIFLKICYVQERIKVIYLFKLNQLP